MEKVLSIPELRSKGLEVLLRELGPVGYVEFLRDMGLVQDDFTEWRRKQPEPKSVQEAVKLIQQESKPISSRTMNLLDRITVDPAVMAGRPCIRGMRIRVKDVLGILAGGASEEEILRDFPYLEREDIRACFAYAAVYFDHSVHGGR